MFALINLALLTGHVGRYGSGLVPLRGQNNVQGGGDMGAIPNKLTGFQDVETDLAARARFEAVYGAPIPPRSGWHLSQMFEAMEDGELTACYIIGENPLRSEADTGRARKLLSGLEHLVVQDMFLTDTAEARRRGAARHGHLVRGRGHGDLQRAPGAAGAQGARAAARRARRHRDHLRDRPAPRHRLGPARQPRTCGTSCAPCPPCTRA